MAKIKYYHLNADAVDSNGVKHKVTVVGKFVQKYVHKPFTEKATVNLKRNKTVNGHFTYDRKVLERTLTIGVSICNPTDDFNEEEGIRIAKKRIEEGKDAGKIMTNSVTMLTEDLILAELLGKLTYITSNIESYIAKMH